MYLSHSANDDTDWWVVRASTPEELLRQVENLRRAGRTVLRVEGRDVGPTIVEHLAPIKPWGTKVTIVQYVQALKPEAFDIENYEPMKEWLPYPASTTFVGIAAEAVDEEPKDQGGS